MKEFYDTIEDDGEEYEPVFEKIKHVTEYEIIIEEEGENPEIINVDEIELIRYIVSYAGYIKTKLTITPLKMKENK